MSDKHRVRLVVQTGRTYQQIETRPMPRAEADKIAAEAVALGIPAAVRKA